LEKLGLDDPEEETFQSRARKERGNFLEPYVCAMWELKSGEMLKAKDEIPTIIHPKYPFMRVNVDGILQDGAILEAKSTSVFCLEEWGDEGTGQIPKAHVLQVAYNSFVCNAPYAIVGVTSDAGCWFYKYTRNPKLEEVIENKVKTFWEEHVLKKIPPVPMAASDINHLYPETTQDSAKVIIDEIKFHWENYVNTKEHIKDLEKQADSAKFEIMKFMEDSEYLVDERQKKIASFKYMCGRTNLSVKKLKEEKPDIYQQYATIGKPIRTLRIIDKE
jgi:predicted phage-related endonuclease